MHQIKALGNLNENGNATLCRRALWLILLVMLLKWRLMGWKSFWMCANGSARGQQPVQMRWQAGSCGLLPSI